MSNNLLFSQCVSLANDWNDINLMLQTFHEQNIKLGQAAAHGRDKIQTAVDPIVYKDQALKILD